MLIKLVLLFFAFLLVGCGVSAGGFVFGTTGFLREHNRVRSFDQARLPEISNRDRAEMNAFLEREYGKR